MGGLAAKPRRGWAKTAARGFALVWQSATAVPSSLAMGRRPQVLLEQMPTKGAARRAGHRPGALLLMAIAMLVYQWWTARPPQPPEVAQRKPAGPVCEWTGRGELFRCGMSIA